MSAAGAQVCKQGCGRQAFGKFDTCCTHCKGQEGPHARDCETKAVSSSSAPPSSAESERFCPPVRGESCRCVIVRIVKAKLFRSFDKFGKMDPFAQVMLLRAGSGDVKGMEVDLGQTLVAKGAHMDPEWNHMCHHTDFSLDDKLHVQVSEANFAREATFCGEVLAPLAKLLSSESTSPNEEGLLYTELQDLTLMKRGEPTGTVTVQLLTHRFEHTAMAEAPVVGGSCGSSGLRSSGRPPKQQMPKEHAKVSDSLFVTPVKRLGVSGGTAPFFELRLKDPPAGISESYWIGKDLSHAMDEITFYEELLQIRQRGNSGAEAVVDFTFEYLGVLEAKEEGAENDGIKKLLVLRNLRDGCEKLRMLDIKIGEQTAAAGWQGKSRFAALRQSLVDASTNSAAEGFRVEGFDGMPPVLESFDPLMDFRFAEGNPAQRKKAHRILLQRMSASEAMMHFSDMHQDPKDVENNELGLILSPTEYAEIIVSETARRLAALAATCRGVLVPQKWIGSSVALGFDAGQLPERGTAEEAIRSTVLVSIFDWGRSELNTVVKNTSLSADEQADRLTFWRYYVGGIDRLAWEASRAHWQRFRNTSGWKEVILDVYDYDSATANDFIGQARLALPPRPGEVTLQLKRGDVAVNGANGVSTITVSAVWRDFPAGSRLKGAWRVSLLRASNLPGLDKLQGVSTSDPLVLVQAVSEDGAFHFCQQSIVVKENVDPEWNETFELSVASNTAENPLHLLLGASEREAAALSEQELFPPCPDLGGCDEADDAAFSLWSKTVNGRKDAYGRRLSFGLTMEATVARRQSALNNLKKFSDSVISSVAQTVESVLPQGRTLSKEQLLGTSSSKPA